MKNNSVFSIILSITATIFYIAAIITFATNNDSSMGSVWLSLGSVFLCLNVFFNRKQGEKKAEDEKEDKSEK